MVSRKDYNLNTNEGFVIFLTSKLITCFIGGFTLIMKPQSIAYLLNGSEHIYQILDLEGEVYSIWDLCVSGLQECKSNEFFFKIGRTSSSFRADPKNVYFFEQATTPARSGQSEKFVGGSQRPPSITNNANQSLNSIHYSKHLVF